MQKNENGLCMINGHKYYLFVVFNPITDEIVTIYWLADAHETTIQIGSLFYVNEQLHLSTDKLFKIPLPVIEYARDLAEIYLENNKHLEKQNDNA